MNKLDIIQTINNFLVEEFEVDPEIITEEANIKEALELDSLDFVDIVVLVEKHFHFKMAAEEFVKIPTFGEFYDFVADKLNEKISI